MEKRSLEDMKNEYRALCLLKGEKDYLAEMHKEESMQLSEKIKALNQEAALLTPKESEAQNGHGKEAGS